MAGAFTKANAGKLAARLGRDPTEGELYIAHFLGATGASRLIGLADSSPRRPRGRGFPERRAGQSDDLLRRARQRPQRGEVYHLWSAVTTWRAADRDDTATTATAAKADESPPGEQRVRAGHGGPDRDLCRGGAAVAGGAGRTTSARCSTACSAAAAEEPVAPLVNSLWTSPQQPDGAVSSLRRLPAARPRRQRRVAAGGELGLFQDQVPDARALFRGRV